MRHEPPDMFNQLYNSVKMRFGDSNASMSMGDWICANTTLKKRPFTFADHQFQKAIADDMHQNLSVKKCSQIGLTEIQIRKYLAILTRSTAINGIFSMPNEKMFTKTYNGRIKPILEADDVFNPPSTTKPTRSKDQIQIRDSFGYITACTEGDATSISADFLFHDELDLSPQEIIALYQSRLQASDMQMTQSFSTPTFVNFGIDKNYKLTDQREYFIKCPSCGHHQVPRFTPAFVHLDDFPFDVENFTDLTPQDIAQLNLENAHVRCEKCHSRLDLGDHEHREWVATFPTRTNFRGYQVRPFSTPRIKPAYIFGQLAQYQERNFLRGFFNTVLGEEYTSADAKLQRADIEACMLKGTSQIPNVSADTPCYIGIDVGFTCHITVSYDDPDGWPHFVLFESIPVAYLEKRVLELMKIYTIIGGTIDRFPYTTDADSLRDVSQKLIMPVQYRGHAALAPVFEADTKIISHYSANNTIALDRVKALVTSRNMTISGYLGGKELVISHLTDMVRNDAPDQDEMGQWIKVSGNDHYFHSMAFNLLARRVSEHMFATQLSTTATSGSFFGQSFGNAGPGLDLGGGASMKSISRVAGLK
jgi:hypothetical protein